MPVLKDNLTKIFVYGTLKRNQPNYEKMTDNRGVFVDEAVTVERWPLVVATEAHIPFLLYHKDNGYNVKGEIYMVDDEALAFLDYFEGLDQNFYSKKLILVKGVKDDAVHEAYCYMLEGFKPYLLENPKSFLEEYDSESNKLGQYNKRIDTADRADSLIEQVKFI